MAEGIEVCSHVRDGGGCANLAKGALQNAADFSLSNISFFFFFCTTPCCEMNHNYHKVLMITAGEKKPK